jgi:hypothetical protein
MRASTVYAIGLVGVMTTVSSSCGTAADESPADAGGAGDSEDGDGNGNGHGAPDGPNPPTLGTDREVAFGEVPAGESATVELEAVVYGEGALTVQGVDIDREVFSIEVDVDEPYWPLTLEDGDRFTYRVTFAPESNEPVVGWLEFLTDSERVTSLRLTGNQPCNYIDPVGLLFEEVTIGDSLELTAVLSNCYAQLELEVESISTTEARPEGSEVMQVVGDPTPTVLAPGESADIVVRFTPEDTIEYGTVKSVSTNAGELLFRTRGFGVAP